MKITHTSACFGKFDQLLQENGDPIQRCTSVPEQQLTINLFSEENCPFPLNEFRGNPRMLAKYFKLQPHKIIPDQDIYIWTDASVICHENFINNIIEIFRDPAVDIITTSHPQRSNVYDEFRYNIDNIHIPYLASRYNKEALQKELEFVVKAKMPFKFPLFSAGIFAIRGDETEFLDSWWEGVLQFSAYDQVRFSYELWQKELKYVTIQYYNEFFTVRPHPKK